MGGVAIAVQTSLNLTLIEINPPLKQLLLKNNIDLIGLKITNIDGLPSTSFWYCYSPIDSFIPYEVWYLSSNSPIITLFLQAILMPITLPGAPLRPPDGVI